MSFFAMLAAAALTLLTLVAFSLAGRLLGPRPRHQGDAEVPFETGMRPLSPAGQGVSALYWRFAVLFVVFDVDLMLLLPWALNKPRLSLGMMLSMTAFVGLVAFMLAYFWRKGVLDCRS